MVKVWSDESTFIYLGNHVDFCRHALRIRIAYFTPTRPPYKCSLPLSPHRSHFLLRLELVITSLAEDAVQTVWLCGCRGNRTCQFYSPEASCSALAFVQKRHSHVGSAPLYVARTTTVSDLPFAPVTNPTRKQPKGLQNAKAISVTGPLGTVVVPIQEYVTIHWDKDASSSSPSTPAARSGEEDARRLTISVANESDKRQRSVWGLTRALLSNAIEGVQEGHTVTLRLVGVGYRAAVETDPFPRPDKFQSTFAAIGEAISSMAGPSNESTKLGNFTSAAQRDFYGRSNRSAAC
ncbi:hypothetical protein IEQ34_025294 [Dendrobium chrysotoxum]|uniref:Uncharacterized protein n=1 Tax=Dendrobium chrysotoxum TaxID=161865 RepID=A0AAV7FQ68_DENCH|nr:hypothetical protein IEQ34_025294 [Dendrobium chrysotoxum]